MGLPECDSQEEKVSQEVSTVNSDGILSEKLANAAELSLDWSVEILKRKLPEASHESFGAICRAKSHAANTVLTLVARTDEAQLQRRMLDRLPELLKLVHAEERRGHLINGKIG